MYMSIHGGGNQFIVENEADKVISNNFLYSSQPAPVRKPYIDMKTDMQKLCIKSVVKRLWRSNSVHTYCCCYYAIPDMHLY